MKYLTRILAILILAAPCLSHAGITIASWNIKHLGHGNDKRDWQATAKVAAPYDFVALQEVHNTESVKRLEKTLENMTGKKWDSVISDRSVGRGRYKEMYAFLYKESTVSYDGGAVIYLDMGDHFAREPFAARFKSTDGKYRWTAASIHVIYGKDVTARKREALELDEYVLWLEREVSNGSPVLLMGDFNLKPNSDGFRDLRQYFKPAITSGATTLSSKNGRYANLYDNIWYRPGSIKPTGASIDKFPKRLKMTHEQARKAVSDHAPVFIALGHGMPKRTGSAPRSIPSKAPKAAFSASPYQCGKRYCSEMKSCDEAIFHLRQCGRSSMDGDGNGIPCESICR